MSVLIAVRVASRHVTSAGPGHCQATARIITGNMGNKGPL